MFKDKFYAKYALVFIGFFLILIQQAVTIVNINNNVYQRIVRYLVPTYYDWRRALANTMLMIVLVLVYYFVKKYKTIYDRNKSEITFLEHLLMFSLGVSVCPELLDRLLIPVIVLSFPVVLEYFDLLKTNVNCTSNKNSYRLMYYISVFVFIVGTSFMWAYRFAMWKSWRLIWW